MKIHMDRLQVRSNQPAKTETRVNIFEEVFKVLANVEFPQIYPDPDSRFLRAKLVNYFTFIYSVPTNLVSQAAECGIPAENILVGCGADEVSPAHQCILQRSILVLLS